MASTETLDQRLSRQTEELSHLVTVGQDAITVALESAHARLIEAGKADDADAINTVNDEITALHAKRKATLLAAELKQHAVAETTRQIEARKRAAAVKRAEAHVKTLADLAPECQEALDNLVDVIGRQRGQLAGLYTALNGYGHDQAALLSAASVTRLSGDILWHLKNAFGQDNDPAVHGTVLDMQADLENVAATIR